MSSFKQALREHLQGFTPLGALIGGGTTPSSGRVFWGYAHQDEVFPYIILRRVGDQPIHHLLGSSRIRAPKIDLEIWAKTAYEAETIETQVEACLGNFVGYMDDVPIRISRLEDVDDDDVALQDGDPDRAWLTTMSLQIWRAT